MVNIDSYVVKGTECAADTKKNNKVVTEEEGEEEESQDGEGEEETEEELESEASESEDDEDTKEANRELIKAKEDARKAALAAAEAKAK